MKITRVSPMTGKENSLELRICQAQLDDYYVNGRLLQSAFANLEPWQRDFIKFGYTLEDQRRMYNEPLFAPGDRFVYKDFTVAGFVVSVEPYDSEKEHPKYMTKFDGVDDVRETSQNEMTMVPK